MLHCHILQHNFFETMSKENITFRIDSDRNSWAVCSIHKLKSAL
ncbi:hypothetical protein [Nostoc sp.]